MFKSVDFHRCLLVLARVAMLAVCAASVVVGGDAAAENTPAEKGIIFVSDMRDAAGAVDPAVLDLFSEIVRDGARRYATGYTLMDRENAQIILKDFGKDLSQCMASGRDDCEVAFAERVQADIGVSGQILKMPDGGIRVVMKMFDVAKRSPLNSIIKAASSITDLERVLTESVAELYKPLHRPGSGGRSVAVTETATTGYTQTGTVKAGMTVDLGEKIVNQVTDQKGFLTVKSRVSGETGDARATILLNGKEFRPSPFTAEMMIGDYVVAARLDDYHHTATQKISLGVDGKTVELELRPTFGALVVETDPADAEILINGSVVGRSVAGRAWVDNRRKAGTYAVEVRKGLYRTATRTVTVNEGAETKEKIKLDPDFGNLKITSKPSGASVFVDGRDAGKTPLTLNDLSSGEHSLRVSVDYYMPESVQVTLGEGKTVTKHFDLRTDFGGIKLTSDPAGAAITIDGAATGKVTPMSFSPVRPGVHVVTLELEGHGKLVQTVNVENGVDVAAVMKLEPKLGMLSVIVQKEDGSPCEGEVSVDGMVVGRSPWKGKVLATRHQVEGKCPEGLGAKTVVVPHNGSESLVLEVGDRGQLSVRTLDADGRECSGSLTVDGKAVGASPWSDWLKAGTYKVVGTCGKTDGAASLTLARGERKSVDLKMSDKGIEWVRIPGGSFKMGSNSSSYEKPVHSVNVPTFEIAKTEVTVAQYRKCVEAGACSKLYWDDGSCYVYTAGSWQQGNLPSSFRGDNQPVVCIDRDQSSAYAKWVGGRLPTEAEWEYAARGDTRGVRYGDLDAVAWYDKNSGGHTHPVGQKQANKFGLMDMLGNVWEWCQDMYHSSYKGAPSNGSAWESPSDSYCVSRGGSWAYEASEVRAAYRNLTECHIRSFNLGLRPARSVR